MSLPERLDPNFWGQQDTQDREVRAEEANIRQSGASAGSSEASTQRTLTLTPIEAERQRGQLRVERVTEEPTIRKATAQADLAETRAAQARIALERTRRGRRPTSDALTAAQDALVEDVRRLVAGKQLIQDRELATGFGSTTLANFGDTAAAQLDNFLRPIRANNAFNKIVQLRAESPTGAGLGGNTSDKDTALLEASEGSFALTSSDEQLIAEMDNAIEARLRNAAAIGVDPYELADILGPANIDQFAPMLRSWRPLPEDEQAIVRYTNEARASGNYDPADYAALMAQAYERSTGKEVDEGFINAALAIAYELQEDPTPISGITHDAADAAVRDEAVTRVRAEGPQATSLYNTLGGAAANFAPSLYNLGVDTVSALTVNLPDTLEGVVGIVAGATGISENTEDWDALKQYYTDRYGSREGFRRALMTDPAGILADVVGVATLGGTTAAKSLGVAGRVTRIAELANAARTAERFTVAAGRLDPFRMATQTATNLGRLGGNVVRTMATTTPAAMAGVPAGAVEQAVSAGRRGSQAFTEQLTRAPTAPNIVDQLDTAVQELYSRRSLEYQNARNQLNLNETVPFTEIDRALLDTQSVGRYRDIDYRRAPEAWQEASDIVEKFRSAGYNDVEAVDAMKQQLGALRDSYPLGSAERAVVQDIYNGVRTAITTAAPEYAKMMEDYAAASDALADIRATLATNAASPDTTLRRLQQQVGGRGPRGRTVLDILEGTQSGRGLGDAVAGLVFSGAEPSRVANLGGTIAAGGGIAAGTPEMAIPAAMVSLMTPQRVGNAAYNIGRGAGAVERGARRLANAPIAGGRSLADLTRDYGIINVMLPNSRFSRSLRVANPAVIQPIADPYEPTDVEPLAVGVQPAPYVDMLPTPEMRSGSGVALEDLINRYNIVGAAPDGPVSLEQLSAQYTDAPTQPPTAGEVRDINGRPAVFDPTEGWVDEDTGALIEEAAYKRGGRVTKRRGGPVHLPKPVSAPRRPVPTRALRG